jgi:hypothetical protein
MKLCLFGNQSRFVARQFALLLGRMRPNPWPKIAMFAASIVFVLILCSVVVEIPRLVQLRSLVELQSLRISVTNRGGKLFAKFDESVTIDATVTSALPTST